MNKCMPYPFFICCNGGEEIITWVSLPVSAVQCWAGKVHCGRWDHWMLLELPAKSPPEALCCQVAQPLHRMLSPAALSVNEINPQETSDVCCTFLPYSGKHSWQSGKLIIHQYTTHSNLNTRTRLTTSYMNPYASVLFLFFFFEDYWNSCKWAYHLTIENECRI